MTHQHESVMQNKLKLNLNTTNNMHAILKKQTQLICGMQNTLKRRHTTKTKTTINKTHPPPNKISSVRTGNMKTIEGKGTPLRITVVEVVEAAGKPGAGRAGPA